MTGLAILVAVIVLCLWAMGLAIRERDWRTAAKLAGLALVLFVVCVLLGAIIFNAEDGDA